MISARYCLFLLFCEKSPKTLPFLLPFSRKGQTEEKLHQKKNFFHSETTTNTARNTQKKKKKERKDDAREIVRCCGNGAFKELGPTEMWTWDWCSIARIF